MSTPTKDLAEQYFQPKIDLIQHLIQYSQNILLVTAPAGGGKSAFAEFCLSYSMPHLKKHLLQITSSLSVEKMMENIAKGFGMSWPQNGPLASDAVQKIWTLFVEDAHLLNMDMLEALVRLVNFHQEPRRQLHLVLLGEEKMVSQFSTNRITNLVGSYSTVIELGLPTQWRQSYVEHFSQPVLVKKENKSFDEERAPVIAAPQPEFGTAFDVKNNRDFEEQTETDFLLGGNDIDLLDEETQAPEPKATTNNYKHLFSHPVAYGLYLGAIVGVSLWSWQSREVPEYIPESAQVVANSEPVAIHKTQVLAKTLPEPEPMLENEESYAELPFVLAKSEPAKLEPKKVVASKLNNKPKLKATTKIAKKTTQPGSVSERTILAKNKNHYTVQLYGSNEPQKVAQFKQAHGLDKALVVTKKHQGQTWHVLVLGDYPSKIQAEKATQRLPQSVYHAKVKPWVREFSSLQDEIVNSRKNT